MAGYLHYSPKCQVNSDQKQQCPFGKVYLRIMKRLKNYKSTFKTEYRKVMI